MGSKRGHHRQQDTRQSKAAQARVHTSPDDPDAEELDVWQPERLSLRWIKKEFHSDQGAVSAHSVRDSLPERYGLAAAPNPNRPEDLVRLFLCYGPQRRLLYRELPSHSSVYYTHLTLPTIA